MLQREAMTHVLRELREERDLTMQELATKAGVSVGTVYKAETGRVQPFGRTLHKLARALGVPVGVLRQCGPAGSPRQERLPLNGGAGGGG